MNLHASNNEEKYAFEWTLTDNLFSPLIGLEKKCEYVSINNRNRG